MSFCFGLERAKSDLEAGDEALASVMGMEVMIILSPASWLEGGAGWPGVATSGGLVRWVALSFRESFRSGARDSVSALRQEGGGRVETKEAAPSVLLWSTYGSWWGWADMAWMLWS